MNDACDLFWTINTTNNRILFNPFLKITGKISVTFLGFITKTIPIEVIIITSVEKIFENLEIPDIDVEAHLTDLSEEGIEFSAKVDVYNPTSLIYNIDNLYLDFITNQGVDVGNISVDGGLVKPKSNSTFISTGLIKYQALDAELLILKLTGIAGARVGGISKNISFSTDASLTIPNLKDFVFGDTILKILFFRIMFISLFLLF